MRLFRNLFIIVILLGCGLFYLLQTEKISSDNSLQNQNHVFQKKKNDLETKLMPEKRLVSSTLKGDLYQWIGNSTEELTKELGKPNRKDLSAYGYTWWVYTDEKEQYIQFGIADNQVKTVFATGEGLSTEPLKIGQSYDSTSEYLTFDDEVTFNKGIASYSFQLNKEDKKLRPLVKITDNLFIQCYFDSFTNKLSAIRILTGDVLLQHRPYELHYRGDLPKRPSLSDKEWKKVEKGMEQQIFDITNVMRTYYDKSQLDWEDTVRDVAFLHSKDMAKNNYFSHYSLNGSGLKERLADKQVYYFAAGENIAAQYPDAPAAIEGWLNSKGHREALLNEDYTHLGVGVYRFYYTQNFIAKPL